MTATISRLGPRLGNSPLTCFVLSLGLARPGTALEFGVARGDSLTLLADAPHLDPVVGFDSFAGLPEDWRPGFRAGKFATTPPNVPGANLVIGPFEKTLPVLLGGDNAVPGWMLNLSLIHVDCDLYSSTKTVLEWVGPYLTPGTLVLFDEFHGYPEAGQHEQRAWTQYVERTGIEWEPLGHGPEQLLVRVL